MITLVHTLAMATWQQLDRTRSDLAKATLCNLRSWLHLKSGTQEDALTTECSAAPSYPLLSDPKETYVGLLCINIKYS